MRRTRVLLGGMIAASIAGAIYARTLAPGVTAGDGGELVLAARDLGVPHPPGYPLWVLLAHLATLVPVGELAARVNAFSAACAAIATGALWILGARLRLGVAARAAACAVFALSTVVWRSAVQAEVYATATLAFLALVALAFAARSRRPGAARRDALYFTAAGLAALAHQTLVFPALLLAGWILARRFTPGRLARAAGWVLLGFTPVVLIPIRAGVPGGFQFVPDAGFAALPDLLLRHGYGGLRQMPWSPALAGQELAAMGAALASGLGWPALVLAGAGALWGVRRRLLLVPALAATTVPVALVAIVVFRPDAEHLAQVTPFLAPVVVVVALLAGAGVEALRRVRVPEPARVAGRFAAPAAAAAVALSLAVTNFALCDRSGFTLPARYGRELLAGLPRGATLVLEGDNETFLAAYAQREGGVRPDVTLLHRRGYIFGDPYRLRGVPRSRWTEVAHRVDLERLERRAGPVYYATPPGDLSAAGVGFVREGLVYRAAPPGLEPGASRSGPVAASPSPASPPPVPARPAWPRSTELLGGSPWRFDYVERKLAVTWSDVMARSLWEQDRPGEALPWFEDAARVGFDFPEARVNLAVVAEALGRREQAAAELLTAHSLDPRRPEAAARLAALLARAGQYGEAARWFERAYGARPDPALASLAARAWDRAGDPARARLWRGRAGSSRAEGPGAGPGGSPDETLGSRA